MGPKKNKKKNKNDSDSDEFSSEAKPSKWAQALDEKQSKQQPNAEQLYSKPTKAIFEFDFSRQRDLDLREEVVKPFVDKFANLTPEEKQQMQKMKEKAKVDKQAKNQIKNEKKKERKKEIEAQKVIEQAEKQQQEEDNKKIQSEIQKQKSKQSSPWIIPLGLLLFMVLMFFMQYQKEIHERLSKFKNDSVDYYKVLEADQGITDKELKNKYKKLVMKYHPDRNPDCKDCKEKFDEIMRSWEVLGDPEKRKSYDQNSGYISELKSASQTLTPLNYGYLIGESKKLWLIQVFDSTNQYSRYFAQFWEQMVLNYGDVVNFGRIDIWLQSDMTSYIPYKFQVFPSIYYTHDGSSEICSINFERPIEGMKRCIEEFYNQQEQNIVKEVTVSGPEKKQNKISVFMDGKLRANLRVKAINRMYEEYFDFYYVQQQPKYGRNSTLFSNGKAYSFNFTENSKKIFSQYSQFLQNFIIQTVTTCSFLHQCSQSKCMLILNETKLPFIRNSLPLKYQIDPVPIYILSDQHQLQKQLNRIQQVHEQFQNYDIGLYENGRIDLGYVDDSEILNAEEGERLDLQCKVYTWREILGKYCEEMTEYFMNRFGL